MTVVSSRSFSIWCKGCVACGDGGDGGGDGDDDGFRGKDTSVCNSFSS